MSGFGSGFRKFLGSGFGFRVEKKSGFRVSGNGFRVTRDIPDAQLKLENWKYSAVSPHFFSTRDIPVKPYPYSQIKQNLQGL